MGMDAALSRITQVQSYMDQITQRTEDLAGGFSDILDDKLAEIAGISNEIPVTKVENDATAELVSSDALASTSGEDLAALMQMSSLMGTSSLFDTSTDSSSLLGDSSLFDSLLGGTSTDSSLFSSLLGGTSSDSSLYSSLLGGSSYLDSSSILNSALMGSDFSSLLGGTSYSNDLIAYLYSQMAGQSGSGSTPASIGLTKIGDTADFTGAAGYMDIVNQAAETYRLPSDLILAVMKVESSFVNEQTSSAGAQGLMQLMPGTAEYLGVTDVMNPTQNINAGAKYLRELLDSYDNDARLALAAYNTGPGNVNKSGATSSFSPEYYNISEGVRGYVDKVLGYAGYAAIAS